MWDLHSKCRGVNSKTSAASWAPSCCSAWHTSTTTLLPHSPLESCQTTQDLHHNLQQGLSLAGGLLRTFAARGFAKCVSQLSTRQLHSWKKDHCWARVAGCVKYQQPSIMGLYQGACNYHTVSWGMGAGWGRFPKLSYRSFSAQHAKSAQTVDRTDMSASSCVHSLHMFENRMYSDAARQMRGNVSWQWCA